MSSDPRRFILDYLDPRGGNVVSVVGGGGKTSLLAAAAQEFSAGGTGRTGGLVLTTTTRLQRPCPLPAADLHVSPSDPPRFPETGGRPVLWVGGATADGGKWEGPEAGALDAFTRSPDSRRTLLIEADGSAGCPLKLTADHEPVIPDATTVVVAVLGLSALDRPADSGTIHRPEFWKERTGGSPGGPVTGDHLYRLITHPLGSFRGARPGMRRLLVLNQADTPELVRRGERLARRVLEAEIGVEAVLITSFIQEPAIRSIIGT